MIDYNERFLEWLETIRPLEPKKPEDIPESLTKEFQKLILLAEIPFRRIYGESPESMEELLRVVLKEEDFLDAKGTPLHVTRVEKEMLFVSPVTGFPASPALYAEDDKGNCYCFFHCDCRGPNVAEQAAVIDMIHGDCRKQGLSPKDFPDVYIIYFTDYDVGRRGQQIYRLEYEWEKLSDEEWEALGAAPDQPDPVPEKFHTILYNAAFGYAEDK